MITEDYVSFETAKLLKEKGFDENCTIVYNLNNRHSLMADFYGVGTFVYNSYLNKERPELITAPTIQMARKWLREKKGIAIIPVLSSVLDNEKFLWDIKIVVAKHYDVYSQRWIYEKQEDACDAAIKYCLENLI